ncbi:MAG: succinate dehydrogenase/fumarate reductase flavoprotein subunit, partial [Clostridia bacterium]|nr:succinate dehydrogenase/fumarate reductase flavoprotein subunit [Clostridia bacterium]
YSDGLSVIENLYVAVEEVGGIHGRNRLMVNSLLDIIVFGRNAGRNAGAKSKTIEKTGALTLDHVEAFKKQLDEAGIVTDVVSPKLLPTYTHGNPDITKMPF